MLLMLDNQGTVSKSVWLDSGVYGEVARQEAGPCELWVGAGSLSSGRGKPLKYFERADLFIQVF